MSGIDEQIVKRKVKVSKGLCYKPFFRSWSDDEEYFTRVVEDVTCSRCLAQMRDEGIYE